MWDPTPVASARISPRPSLAGAYFDAAAADAAQAFFRWYIRFSAGPCAGAVFELEPWQAWIVRQAFGWKRADGRRLYRRVILWVPRKNGKTELLAGVAHIALLALGCIGGDVFSIAATEDQASQVFRAAQAMAGYSDALAQRYELLKKSIYCPELHTSFRPLTAKPHGKHGLKTLVLIGDEAHEWKTGDLHHFVRQSMGLWPEPMEWIISTAGNPEGYGYELFDECERIVEGSLQLDDTLALIFGADAEAVKSNEALIYDEDVHRAANPNFGVSLDPEYIRSEARRARASASVRVAFRRYHLNLWTADTAAQWLPAEHWSACTTTPSDRARWRSLEAECAGRECYGGLDLASTRDTNALVWVFPPDAAHPKWTFLYRVFLPRESDDAQRTATRIPIEQWETDEAIRLTPGNAADHDAIYRQVTEDCGRFRVNKLGIDPFNAHQISIDLAADGVPILVVPQRMATLSAPAKVLERLVLEHRIEHGSHPVARWQAACCAIRMDDQANIMPTKRRSSGKIDTVAASITAIAVGQLGAGTGSYLETSPLLVL